MPESESVVTVMRYRHRLVPGNATASCCRIPPAYALITALLTALWLVVLTSCSKEVPVLSGATMGTTYRVIVPHLKQADQSVLKAGIDAELKAINNAMSTYQNDSAISLFNTSGSTEWFDVPRSFAVVLDAALEIADASEGAFDPTVGPLVERWGFGKDPVTDLPSAEEVELLLDQTGFEKLSIDAPGARIKKAQSNLPIDLNAIAKGYAVDQLAVQVEMLGYLDYLVEIGGEVRVHGHNADAEPWRIGIEQPSIGGYGATDPGQSGASQSGLELTNGAVATSGDYRNAFEHDGRRYSHIIDARRGVPVSHELASVSVVAKSAMLADGWATALMVLGPEEGLRVAEKLDLACFFIVRDKNTGFKSISSTAFRRLDQI